MDDNMQWWAFNPTLTKSFFYNVVHVANSHWVLTLVIASRYIALYFYEYSNDLMCLICYNKCNILTLYFLKFNLEYVIKASYINFKTSCISSIPRNISLSLLVLIWYIIGDKNELYIVRRKTYASLTFIKKICYVIFLCNRSLLYS